MREVRSNEWLELALCILTKCNLPAFCRVPELHLTGDKPVRLVRKVVLRVAFEPSNGFLVFLRARFGKNLQQPFISWDPTAVLRRTGALSCNAHRIFD